MIAGTTSVQGPASAAALGPRLLVGRPGTRCAPAAPKRSAGTCRSKTLAGVFQVARVPARRKGLLWSERDVAARGERLVAASRPEEAGGPHCTTKGDLQIASSNAKKRDASI